MAGTRIDSSGCRESHCAVGIECRRSEPPESQSMSTRPNRLNHHARSLCRMCKGHGSTPRPASLSLSVGGLTPRATAAMLRCRFSVPPGRFQRPVCCRRRDQRTGLPPGPRCRRLAAASAPAPAVIPRQRGVQRRPRAGTDGLSSTHRHTPRRERRPASPHAGGSSAAGATLSRLDCPLLIVCSPHVAGQDTRYHETQFATGVGPVYCRGSLCPARDNRTVATR